jgi:hypothetical protein
LLSRTEGSASERAKPFHEVFQAAVMAHSTGLDQRVPQLSETARCFWGCYFWSDNAGGRKIVIRDIPTATEPVAQVNMMMNLGYIVKAKEIAALSAAVLAKFGPIPPAQHPMPVTAAMTRDDLLWTRSTNSTMK